MNRKSVVFSLVLTFLALATAGAQAQEMYITPGIVFTDDDGDRLVDDQFGGGQIAVGRYIHEQVAIEAVLEASSLDGVDNLDLTSLGVNARFVFNRENRIQPYVLVGAGFQNEDSDLFPSGTDGYLNVGGGVEAKLGNSPAALRAEYKARTIDGSIGRANDNIFMIGLSYAFGGKKEKSMPTIVAVPDSDNDGVNDDADACPNTPPGFPVDSRGCALDSDRDGVADPLDKCMNTVRGASVDADGCELDGDQDGVVDRIDECPESEAGVRVDVKGCEIRDVIELPGVNFETNSDRLLPGANSVLNDAAATLAKYPDLVVLVAGHTDSAGDAGYNQQLSERRAETVRQFLVEAGAPSANLTSRGYGEQEPIADNATAEGRAQNRRVELQIVED